MGVKDVYRKSNHLRRWTVCVGQMGGGVGSGDMDEGSVCGEVGGKMQALVFFLWVFLLNS